MLMISQRVCLRQLASIPDLMKLDMKNTFEMVVKGKTRIPLPKIHEWNSYEE